MKGNEITLTAALDCLYPHNPSVQVQVSYEVIKDNQKNRFRLSEYFRLLIDPPLVFACRCKVCVVRRPLVILILNFLKTRYHLMNEKTTII